MTKKLLNDKSIADLGYNIKRTDDFITGKFGNKYDYEINIFKLNLKWFFLAFSNEIKNYRLWHDWFPEANSYISCHKVSKRVRFVEWCASKKLFWLVKLHYLIVIKFFYTITGK